MSVALLFKMNTGQEKFDSIPISTEDAFAKRWLPGCVALKLQKVPLFSDGIDIESGEIPDILDELQRLRKWMLESYSVQDAEFLTGRLDRLVAKLRELERAPTSEIWIG